jgi:hypothetical protein
MLAFSPFLSYFSAIKCCTKQARRGTGQLGILLNRWIRYTLIALMGFTLAACGLPRSGPSKSELLASQENGEISAHVVNVTPAIANATKVDPSLGFEPDTVGKRE